MPGDVRDRIDKMKDRVDFVTPARRSKAPCLALLLDAAIRRKVLEICYEAKGEERIRKIQPVCLYANNGFWYCTAYCFLRESYRVFRCDRIAEATVDEDAEPIPLRDIRLSRQANAEPRDPVRLRAELSPAGVQRCEAELWLAPMLDVREDGSGRIDRDVSRADIPFYTMFFIGLGEDVALYEPEELRAAIRSKLTELLERYR